MVFPVVMYGCESWTIKRAECQRIDAFEWWSWRRLLRVPWISLKSNPWSPICRKSILHIHWKNRCLKLKLQYFGHLMQRADSLEKTLMLGKIDSKRRRRQQRMRWLDSISDLMDMNVSKLQEIVKDREAWSAAICEVAKSRTWLVTEQQQRVRDGFQGDCHG